MIFKCTLVMLLGSMIIQRSLEKHVLKGEVVGL